MSVESNPPGVAGIFVLGWTTIRRSILIGWRFLVIGTAMAMLLSIVLLVGRHSSAFVTVFPLEIPLFAVLGSTGGLMTFTTDRTKGVFEYLIAYGIRPRSLFADGLLATLAMSAIILGLALLAGLGAAVSQGVVLTDGLWKTIAFYTVPMSVAGGLFVSTIGMIWSSVSTPRTGLNGPVGIAPMFGIGPTVLVLIAAETAPPSEYYYITLGAAGAIILVVIALLGGSARLMGRERFLSPL
jgi:hypothetical protein